MFIMSLNQAIKSSSKVQKAWKCLGCNENKQLYDHKGGGKEWVTDENKQGEVYISVLSVWFNRQNFNSTKT